MMNKHSNLILGLALLLLTSACAAPAADMYYEEAPIEYIVESMAEPEIVEAQPEQAAAAPEGDTDTVVYRSDANQDLSIVNRSNRMIIKDGQILLLVENTDLAIDGVTQVIADVGGYIVSSRVWYQDWGAENYKNASITMGVPVDQFERALRRLRGLALRVEDESATGEDVTDQFVDLQSRLENLEATRDRIRDFLDQATTVEEALTVNEQLSQVEAQIEEIQGRINYLSDRSAYSTLTVTLKPDLPVLTPTPTPTLVPTATPMPTATPEPWLARETVLKAGGTLRSAYRTMTDAFIWIAMVIIPVLGPFALIGWFLWRLSKRSKKTNTEGEENE
jgi:hypothetical protein